jgi:hypothetical protein
MTEKEGTLRMQPSGRWAAYRSGRKVASELKLTRIESTANGRYYSVDGYPLRDGLRAAIGEHG